MRLIFLGIITVLIGVIFWFTETAYYGFNWRPCCHTELVLDTISQAIMVMGIFLIYLDYQPRRKLLGVYTNEYVYDKFIKHQISIFGFWVTYRTIWIP